MHSGKHSHKPLYVEALWFYICASLSLTYFSLRRAIDLDYSILSALMFPRTTVSCRTSLSPPHKNILISSTVLRDYLPAGFTFHPFTQTHCFLCEPMCGTSKIKHMTFRGCNALWCFTFY